MRAKTQIVISAHGFDYTFHAKLNSLNDFLLDYVSVNSSGTDDDHLVPMSKVPDQVQIKFYKEILKQRDNLTSHPTA